jgi:integrase/recombinase XerD
MPPAVPSSRFRLVLDIAGIDRPVTVHSLRHRFAAELHRRTGDLRVVQVALGHRQLGTTEVYSQVGHEDLRDALARPR